MVGSHLCLLPVEPKSRRASDKRRVLLLQGPVGPFFKHLRSAFERAGYDAWHVRFNAADRFFGSRRNSFNYRGSMDDFGSWLEALVGRNKFDAVVLFGASRPIHAVAREVCAALSIPVISLEEGYVRPGFITVEEGGNNYLSPIAKQLPAPDCLKDLPLRAGNVQSSFGRMAFYGFAYFVVHGLFSTPRERRLFHKRERARLAYEAFCWIRNASRKFLGVRRNSLLFQRLLEHHRKSYFVVVLQVSDDAQLVSPAGQGWTNELLSLRVMESFARHGKPDQRLVFKIHPLERGHIDVKSMIRKPAEILGIADRVDVIDDVSMGLLTRDAAGLVTVNSTSGFSAIFHGTPIAVVGDALYAHDTLATNVRTMSDLDAFWMTAHVAPGKARMQYLAWLRFHALAYGDYYLDSEISMTTDAVITKTGQLIDTYTARKVVQLVPLSTGGERKRG